jgi:cytochrome c
MKTGKGALVFLAVLAFIALPAAHAVTHKPEERGRALFTDPNFAGGKRACDSCHPGGRGLARAAKKSEFHIMGGTQDSLEEAVNACIVGANRGKAIDVNSKEMKDLVSYIKSLAEIKPGY